MANRYTTPPTGGQGSTKWQVDRLDGRERRFTYIAAAASLAFGIIIYEIETRNHHFRLAKGQLTPQTTLILGVVFAALLVGAVQLGRRAPVGFIALFTFLAFGTYSFVVGLPFLLLAGWILYHSFKVQREASAALKAGRAETSESGGRQAATTARPPARQSARPSSRSAKASARPEANKRFTPKQAPPPAPKPSRREQRKAAKASD